MIAVAYNMYVWGLCMPVFYLELMGVDCKDYTNYEIKKSY
jgi:hypothetical protein